LVEDVCMSDEAPAVEAAPEGPAEGVAAGQVSAGSGDAPGTGVDAEVAGEAAVEAPAEPPSKWQFLNREFRDQKHAEEVLGSEINKVRGTQRRLSDVEKQLQQRDRELEALRAFVGPGQSQGVDRGKEEAGPQSFADELAKSGELELFAKIAQDPEMGMGHAMYAMAQAFDKRLQSVIDSVRTEAIEPIVRRQEGSERMAKVFSTVKELSSKFPELVDYGENTPPEIADAQEKILQTLGQLPPEWLANNAQEALWYAVTRYRDQHGIPVFAQPPGTSGSPSAKVAAAAEKAAAGTAATPLDGSGVPRQRDTDKPETLEDRWRRESADLRGREATTPSGRKLGFELPT
jgi:hypothetical protein